MKHSTSHDATLVLNKISTLNSVGWRLKYMLRTTTNINSSQIYDVRKLPVFLTLNSLDMESVLKWAKILFSLLSLLILKNQNLKKQNCWGLANWKWLIKLCSACGRLLPSSRPTAYNYFIPSYATDLQLLQNTKTCR